MPSEHMSVAYKQVNDICEFSCFLVSQCLQERNQSWALVNYIAQVCIYTCVMIFCNFSLFLSYSVYSSLFWKRPLIFYKLPSVSLWFFENLGSWQTWFFIFFHGWSQKKRSKNKIKDKQKVTLIKLAYFCPVLKIKRISHLLKNSEKSCSRKIPDLGSIFWCFYTPLPV